MQLNVIVNTPPTRGTAAQGRLRFPHSLGF